MLILILKMFRAMMVTRRWVFWWCFGWIFYNLYVMLTHTLSENEFIVHLICLLISLAIMAGEFVLELSYIQRIKSKNTKK